MVGLETALALALTYLYHTGEMALSDILRRMTINPACILRLPTKGRLAIGSDGDVVIFDPDEAWTVDPNRFASKGRNTPLCGKDPAGESEIYDCRRRDRLLGRRMSAMSFDVLQEKIIRMKNPTVVGLDPKP